MPGVSMGTNAVARGRTLSESFATALPDLMALACFSSSSQPGQKNLVGIATPRVTIA